MKEVTYTDREGRRWRRLLPEGEPDSRAKAGIPAGPPPLDRLRLPLDMEIRLHNELHDRGLFAARDLRSRMEELRAALSAALKLDVQTLHECYLLTDGAGTLTAEGVAP